MAVKPEPFKLRCPACGWHKNFTPMSDVIIEIPPETCPKCGHYELMREPLSTAEALLSNLFSGRLFKSK